MLCFGGSPHSSRSGEGPDMEFRDRALLILLDTAVAGKASLLRKSCRGTKKPIISLAVLHYAGFRRTPGLCGKVIMRGGFPLVVVGKVKFFR